MPARAEIRRDSRQRRLVFEIVERSRNHPTAHQVFDVARREAPAISLGTVYRNLRQLAEQGRIQENKIGGEPARFEVPHRKHYHIWCVECGRLEDLTLPYQGSLDRKAQRLVRYRLQEHRMEFFGVCPECRRPARHRAEAARQGRSRTADRRAFADRKP
jgi:Fe2+ or Zn2+ uptake regulation protein